MGRILKIAVPALFLFFLLAWERAYLIKLNLRTETLRQERDCILTEVHSLEVRVEDLESYSRIERLARTELNMLYPDSKHIVYVKGGKPR